MSKIRTNSPVQKKSQAIAASLLSTALVLGMSPAVALAQTTSTDGVEVLSAESVTSLSSVDVDMTNATTFTFSDGAIAVSKGGVAVDEDDYDGYKVSDNTNLTISASGTYVVSGSCADGTITVKKGTTDVVIVLENLDLTSTTTAPICCNKSSHVTIVAADGTTNTLTDNAQNNDELYPETEGTAENAVIKGKAGSQITLGGTGTLNVVSNGKNGIKVSESTESEGDSWLKIQDLTLNVTANVNDAINCESTLNVESGNLTISAADDAIHSDYVLNIGATGTVGPTITVTSCVEGLEGATLTVNSGNISITATDDGLNAANSDLTDYTFSMTVNGGTLYVNAAGDGLDSNGDLTINGGAVTVYAASQQDNSPLDADGTISINGGTVLGVGYAGMSEGISGTQSCIVFGSTSGAQGGGQGQQAGQGGQQPGQGQDQQSGQQQPGQGQNQAGQGGQQPGQGQGQQPSSIGGATLLSAGTAFTVTDASGTVLASGTAVRDSSYVLFSSSSLAESTTYNLVANGSTIATATVGSSGGNTPGGGTNPNPPSGDSGDAPNPPSGDPGDAPNPPSGDPGDAPNPPSGDPGDAPTPPSGNPGDNQGSQASTVYRLYNNATSEHLYTTDANEVTVLTGSYGWTLETDASWQTPSSDAANNASVTGVYRLYNAALGVHHYTTDKNEVATLTNEYGWTCDNGGEALFYAYSSAVDNSVSVYRLYNGGLSQHLLTESSSEVSALVANYGWTYEGISFYLPSK